MNPYFDISMDSTDTVPKRGPLLLKLEFFHEASVGVDFFWQREREHQPRLVNVSTA